MEISLTFRNDEQKLFYYSKARNNCFSGGFNNGKTYVGCEKMFTFLATFESYRCAIYRETYKNLKATTMQTFFKVCPWEFVHKHDEQNGITVLKNKSLIYWMHLDNYDEQDLRGLEINSGLGDQTEEIVEGMFMILDSRIGRWDGAKVPEHLIKSMIPEKTLNDYAHLYGVKSEEIFNYSKEVKEQLLLKSLWPRNKWGVPRVHNFHDILVNPDNQFHWIYRKFHPDSLERKKKYFYVERETDVDLGDPETMEEMQSRDPEWVKKYFKGQWGRSTAQIHTLEPESVIDVEKLNEIELVNFNILISLIKEKSSMFRVMDHGETAPTCVLFWAALKNIHVCFMEYYRAKTVISEHRVNIWEMSNSFMKVEGEGPDFLTSGDYADPHIRDMSKQKDGKFYSVSDEYSDTDSPEYEGVPPLDWFPADNNEFGTRNRINELLRLNRKFTHPITGVSPAPGVYFIRRSAAYPNGCHFAISQLNAQKCLLVGTDNGKNIYSDERDKAVTDHAYDPIRYYVAMHNKTMEVPKKEPPRRSFANFNRILRHKKTLRQAMSYSD